MAILGGSPLGLINVKSRPTETGKTTFGSGQKEAESGNVLDYNASGKYRIQAEDRDLTDEKSQLVPSNFTGNKSIFSGSRTFKPWPSFKSDVVDDTTGVDNSVPSRLHSNSLYDTSVLNIIQKLDGTMAALKPADFAYLKDIGVYPNNRLMIARRMSSPAMANNNLMKLGKGPLVTLISWVPADGDFISVDFGENWVAAEADFTGVLNDLGNDVTKGSDIGDKAGSLLQAIPLPGFTEIIQRAVLKRLGILGEGTDSYIPAGEPNLIKEAKMRSTVGYSTPGSGLKGTFTVKMTCEYEQKFISGLDPTLVWMDIISMALRFGTSNSKTYGLSGGAAAAINKLADDPGSILKSVFTAVSEALVKAKDQLKILLSQAADALKPKETDPNAPAPGSQAAKDAEAKEKLAKEKQIEKDKSAGNSAVDKFIAAAINVLNKAVGKYKQRIVGIVSALSGRPSTPWHITIGNPMRPVFVSGDMLTTDVKLTLGPTLAFNDLPSSIKIEFTLAPARNLGLQEIFARFNAGHLRTVTYKDITEDGKKGLTASGEEQSKKAKASAEVGQQKEDDKKVESPSKVTGEKKPEVVNTDKNSSAAATPVGTTPSVSSGLTPSGTTISTAADATTGVAGDPRPNVSSTGTDDRTYFGNQSNIINSDASSLSSTKPLDYLS